MYNVQIEIISIT